MKISIILIAAAVVVLIACGPGNSTQSEAAHAAAAGATPPAVAVADAGDAALPKGQLIDSVACRSQPGQSYALYLPSWYTPARQFPCIYFFDAHARGAMPVSAYKALAERYGFVLAGSNVSKNGMEWPATQEAVHALMADTRSRIAIDAGRVYTSGFSGGSRVAMGIAVADGGVTGVLGCAAGFPKFEMTYQNKFAYFGMVGGYDFNLTEMEKLDELLAQNGFAHQLLASGGIHGWAPEADFETGLLWMQINAMKNGKQPKNYTLIAQLKNDYARRIAAAKAAGDLATAHILLQGAGAALDGLADAAPYRQQDEKLTAGAAYKNATVAQAQLRQTEIAGQQELMRQFGAQDAGWWTQKIAALHNGAHAAKPTPETQMNQRLLNYLGLIGYMGSSQAINSGNLPDAAACLQIFKMADPANPDCSYLAALYYMRQNNPQQALAALGEAVTKGYSELGTLLAEPAFERIAQSAEFRKIVAGVRQNETAR